MNWWHGLSVLGSLAVTGPIGVTIAVWLLAGKSWRLTLSWCLLFSAGMALVVITKVAFLGFGIGVEAVEFAGFSGHAMRSGAVFPVAFYLAFRSRGAAAREWALAAGVLLSILISISRVAVRDHTVSEAVSGCLLGFAVAAAFIWQVRDERHFALSRILVALCMPVLLIAPRVEPIPAEAWIVKLSLYLSGREHPYSRNMWRDPVQRSALR